MRTGHPAIGVVLPITPMLDMSFQLLSFFILTFHPRPAEGQFAVTLPPAAGSLISLPDPKPDLIRDEYTVTVSETAGQLLIELRNPAGGSAPVPSLAALRDALVSAPKHPGTTVTVEAAPELPYARLIAVLDIIRKAGLGTIHIAALKTGPA
jgi:biopolymer transport protein ExbD